MMGIIKALNYCQNLYLVPCGFFFKWWPWVDLDHFYDRVKFVPDASVWVTAYRALSALVFPSLFGFSISSAFRWAIQDQWSSGITWSIRWLSDSFDKPKVNLWWNDTSQWRSWTTRSTQNDPNGLKVSSPRTKTGLSYRWVRNAIKRFWNNLEIVAM